MDPATDSPKALVQQMLKHLPDDSSIEDIQYRLYVLEKLRKAEVAAAAGQVVTHEEARRRLSKWLDQ